MTHSIELLESRIAPAILTPVVTKGVMTIEHDSASGTAEHIVITQSGTETDNRFHVQDTTPVTGDDFGNFTDVKSIVIKVGGNTDVIDLDFSHFGLAGSLDIFLSGGTNTINLGTTDNISGLISGKVNIHGGPGADTVKTQDGIAIASPVLFEGGAGLDAFTPAGSYLAKKLTLESVENITVENGTSPVVIGGMLVEDEEANGPITFILSPVTIVAGALTYCGSATEDDNVTLNGEFMGAVKLMLLDGINNVTTAGTYAGDFTILGGNGPDNVTFQSKSLNIVDPTKGPFINATVNGKTTMKLLNGANTVTFQDITYFGKDVSLITGTGVDTVNLTQFTAAKNFTLQLGAGANIVNGASSIAHDFVGGKFKYVGGADDDTVDFDNLIAGSIDVALGNGTNSVTGDLRITGKSANFVGGIDADSISISLASTAGALTARLGAGNDNFTLTAGALLSAKIDGGADDDTLAGLSILPVKKTIANFEHTS